MKKKTKKALFTTLGVVGAVVLSFGTAIVVDCSTGGISGTIVTNVQQGYGDNEWREYDVDLPFGDYYRVCYYTNEDGDYIQNIRFGYTRRDTVRIEYNNYFNIADDFEAFFVLTSNKDGEVRNYITPVETTHWLYGDSIEILFTDLDPSYDYKTHRVFDLIESYHIVEIWIRTVL